jgi:hypothetical protein
MVIQNNKGGREREIERDTCCSVGEEKKHRIREELISRQQRRGVGGTWRHNGILYCQWEFRVTRWGIVRVRIQYQKNFREEDCVSRLCNSLQQKRWRIKSRERKQNLWGKFGRQYYYYYTYGIIGYRGYSKPIATVSIIVAKSSRWYMTNFL